MDKPRRSPARLLAPIALLAIAFAVVMIVGAAGLDGGPGDPGKEPTDTAETADTKDTSTTEAPEPRRKRTYVVKAGDNLDLIADRTGVPVETLEELNPELDPQALVIGQKITLRE